MEGNVRPSALSQESVDDGSRLAQDYVRIVQVVADKALVVEVHFSRNGNAIQNTIKIRVRAYGTHGSWKCKKV